MQGSRRLKFFLTVCVFFTGISLSGKSLSPSEIEKMQRQYGRLRCQTKLAFLNKSISQYRDEYVKALSGRSIVPATYDALMESLQKSRFNFVADNHFNKVSKEQLILILDQIEDHTPTTLVIEFISSRYQKWVDAFLNGKVTLSQMPKEIKSGWPYDWTMYYRILVKAREKGIKILLTEPDRTKNSTLPLSKRDQLVATKILKDAGRNPDTRYLIFYGDFHLFGYRHIPALIKSVGEVSQTVILNMTPRHYFKALKIVRDPLKQVYFKLEDENNVFETVLESPFDAVTREIDLIEE